MEPNQHKYLDIHETKTCLNGATTRVRLDVLLTSPGRRNRATLRTHRRSGRATWNPHPPHALRSILFRGHRSTLPCLSTSMLYRYSPHANNILTVGQNIASTFGTVGLRLICLAPYSDPLGSSLALQTKKRFVATDNQLEIYRFTQATIQSNEHVL